MTSTILDRASNDSWLSPLTLSRTDISYDHFIRQLSKLLLDIESEIEIVLTDFGVISNADVRTITESIPTKRTSALERQTVISGKSTSEYASDARY